MPVKIWLGVVARTTIQPRHYMADCRSCGDEFVAYTDGPTPYLCPNCVETALDSEPEELLIERSPSDRERDHT